MTITEQDAADRHIGGKIRDRRNALGLSQETLAARVGLTRTSIANIEAGRQAPPVMRLAMLATVLRVQLADLIPPVELPAQPPAPHNVSVRRVTVFEVTCETCGGEVLGVVTEREKANGTRRDHIEEKQKAEAS